MHLKQLPQPFGREKKLLDVWDVDGRQKRVRKRNGILSANYKKIPGKEAYSFWRF